MSRASWIACGALLAASGVALGAFGAHARRDRLGAEELASWDTAVRYQMWHALALVLLGALGVRRPPPAFVGWGFLAGSVCFSGSIYLLALGIGKSVVWPLTPLGGSLLIAAWVVLGAWALRGRDPAASRTGDPEG